MHRHSFEHPGLPADIFPQAIETAELEEPQRFLKNLWRICDSLDSDHNNEDGEPRMISQPPLG
jgi:hypothetical protein